MNKVFNTGSQCVHVWAQNTQVEGRCGNLSFKDGTVYSYGNWPMATFVKNAKGEEAVLIRDERYSPSTSRHQAYVRYSLPDFVHRIYVYGSLSDNADNWRPTENMRRDMTRRITKTLQTAKRARKYSAIHIAVAQRYAVAFNDLLEFFDSDVAPIVWDWDNYALLKTLEAQATERAAAYAKKQAAREVEDRVLRIRWESGEDVRSSNLCNVACALRVKPSDPSVIETSHGAAVPASYARRLWELVRNCRLYGRSYEPKEFAVGHFRLQEVTANGNLRIGCHNISYAATRELALKLGFMTKEAYCMEVDTEVEEINQTRGVQS